MDETMEKRLLLSFALSLGVLVIFSWFFAPGPPQPPVTDDPIPAEQAASATLQAQDQREQPVVAGRSEGSGLEPNASPAAPELVTGEIQAAAVEQIVVNTSRYAARISNEGARLESIRLRQYAGNDGSPLELIDSAAATVAGWPLEIVTGDPATDQIIRSALFVVEQQGSQVRLEYASEGLRVVKEFRFRDEGHAVDVEVEVRRGSEALPFSLVWQGEFGDQSRDFDAGMSNLVYFQSGEFERLNVGDLDEPQVIGSTPYVGIEDQFFMVMFRVPEGIVPTATAVSLDADANNLELGPRLEVPFTGPVAVSLYLGPKQQDALREIDPDLVSVIDYGFFGVIVRPLLVALLWIHSYVGNFGWAIVLLTLAINFVLFPLRLKQQTSMLKMQQIQPQMRTLQDRYKKLKSSDPRRQEVQAEMMGLYKKHGVNPVGGCLPVLLQMPFLFAFFTLLRTAIELRGAPWMLWIQDLSAADPYYVLPVLMGGSMLAMQRMTPMTGDPMQVKIMRLMPLMLIVMFLRAQSGLMLYWLTGNLVGVGQQYFINKHYRTDIQKNKQNAEETAAATVPEEPTADGDDGISIEDSSDPKRRKRRGRKKG